MGSSVAPPEGVSNRGAVESALAQLNAAKEEYQRLVQKLGTDAIREGLLRVMELEGASSVYWTQYTPYFNDGDPCEFHVGEFAFPTTKDYGDYEVYDEKTGEDISYSGVYYYEGREGNPPHWQEVREILGALSGMEDLFLAAFGDHVQVLFDGTTFHVEDYSHD